MAAQPPPGARITPYLLYEDTNAAVDWLTRTFGFRENLRATDDQGRITHAELGIGDDVVFLGWPARTTRTRGTSAA